jgi:hypothetical protein
LKKWAVQHFLNATKGKKKETYLKWLGMTEKALLINECMLVSGIFANVNIVIKAVVDNAFLNSKNN